MAARLRCLGRRVSDWIWLNHAPAENGLARWARALVRVLIIVGKEFHLDRIPMRASALTFTVVLAMVPLLALGTSVLKGLGAGGQMRQAAYAFIEQLDAPHELASAGPVVPAVVGREPAVGRNLSSHLHRAVDQVFDYVDQTNFAALGFFGICGLLLAVVALLNSIEEAMNCIWKADRRRSMGRKILDYFAVMILLPVALNLALATEAVLRSPRLFGWLQGVLPMPWLGGFLLHRLPLVVVAVTFSLLYRFLPNTRVRLLPALVGGLVGGVGWFVVQSLYVGLQIGVANYNAIYGSFATLPLFLLWLYVDWLVFLLGAEVAYAIQEWPDYVREEQRLLPSLRLALAFTILAAAGADMHGRTVTTFHSLAERIRQPGGFIRLVLDELVRTGLLRRIDGREPGYAPAKLGDELQPAVVVDLILGHEVAASDLARTALAGAKTALAGKTMVWPAPAGASGEEGRLR